MATADDDDFNPFNEWIADGTADEMSAAFDNIAAEFEDSVTAQDETPHGQHTWEHLTSDMVEEATNAPDEEYIVIKVSPFAALQLIEAWNAIIDHECDGAYNTVFAFYSACVDLVISQWTT